MSTIESKLENYESNKDLVLEWAESQHYSFDGYYEELCVLNPKSKFYVIYVTDNSSSVGSKKAGYFVITMDSVVAFYILREFQVKLDPKDVFKSQVLDVFGVKSANLISLDTYFFNLLLDHQKSVTVLGYAPFICERREILDLSHPLDFKPPKLAIESDEEMIWEEIKKEEFFIQKQEIKPMLEKKQLYLLFQKTDVDDKNLGGIGVLCKSKVFKNVWSIGMFVHPRFRKQGVGTYILQVMQNMCIEAGKIACAGCARPNVGSRKTLQKSGMINRGSFLVVNL